MKTFATYRVERHIDGKVRWMRVAAILCALFASVGIGTGIYESNPSGGYLVPVLAGFIAAAAFAIFWHVAIGGVVNHVKTWVIVVTFIVAVLFTVIALGASAQAIATAVSGRAALAAELSARVDEFNHRLAEAHAEASSWSSVSLAAAAVAAGYEKQVETETRGSNGTGSGCGPRCASYQDIAESFRSGQHGLEDLLAEVTAMRGKGDEAMDLMRNSAAKGDQSGFIIGSDGVSKAITQLNAVDPRPIINGMGAVVVGPKGIDMTDETKEFQAEAARLLAERTQVDAPVFVPMSLGEATRKQVLGSAMHGWIMAGAIDVIPLLLLLLAFVMSREPHAQGEVDVATALTPEAQAHADAHAYDALRARGKDNVTRLPMAGE
jgi:hypothetical protein